AKRVASLLAVAVLGFVFVWSHHAALAARLDASHVTVDARQIGQLLEPDGQDRPASDGAGTPHATLVARAQAEAMLDALRAVAVVSAACAFAGAAIAAAAIQPRK
ncbi:MFS transporter, partial [Paraburkholderia sp. BR14261]